MQEFTPTDLLQGARKVSQGSQKDTDHLEKTDFPGGRDMGHVERRCAEPMCMSSYHTHSRYLSTGGDPWPSSSLPLNPGLSKSPSIHPLGTFIETAKIQDYLLANPPSLSLHRGIFSTQLIPGRNQLDSTHMHKRALFPNKHNPQVLKNKIKSEDSEISTFLSCPSREREKPKREDGGLTHHHGD